MSSSIAISFKIIEYIPNNLNYNNFSFVYKNEQNFELYLQDYQYNYLMILIDLFYLKNFDFLFDINFDIQNLN